MDSKKSIIVLGAGFGGLRAATVLSDGIKKLGLQEKYRITLINKNDYQTYTPTLYEVATTSQETANYLQLKEIVTFPIADAIAQYPIEFVHDTVTELDLITGDVHCARAHLKFDYLVLAIGSETNYFDIPGLREHAIPMKTFMDALRLRDAVLNEFLSGKKDINIVIGGGGSAGVELAGELQEWICELHKEHGERCRASVTIIDGNDTVLKGFDARIVSRAHKRLAKLNVQLMNGERVQSVDVASVALASGRLVNYDILIWTGGVKAATLMGTLPVKKEAKGRVEVLGAMQCLPQTDDLKLYGQIYGIGDAICFYNPETKQPVPLVARAAIIQAGVAANNILEDIKLHEGLTQTKRVHIFQPAEYPYVIPIGGKYAIAKIGPLVISGFFAWVFKGLIELYYISSVLPFTRALRVWLKGLRIFIKNDRLG